MILTNKTTAIPQSQTKALGSINVQQSSGEIGSPTGHSTGSCSTGRSCLDRQETPASELPECVEKECGAMEQQQIHFDGQMEVLQGLDDGTAEAVVYDRELGTEDEGKSDKETSNMSSGKADHQKRLKTNHNSDNGKHNGMTQLLTSNTKKMEENKHTGAGREGNNHTQNNTNEDEEDSYVSSDSSYDVNNPYPTCHNFPTAVREENKRNKAIDRLIAKVNWTALQLKIGSRCMHIRHHQTNIENLETMRRVIVDSVKTLAETLESLPFAELLEAQSTEEVQKTGHYIQDTLVQVGAGITIAGCYTVLMASNHQGSDEEKAASYHLRKILNRNEGEVCDDCGHKNCSGCRVMKGRRKTGSVIR
eukprot:jgi/Psemu1/10040/gm1.10040_g